MANHNQTLNEQLQRSTSEIDTLRTSLESVRVESLTDSLTGLANRRMFDETLRMRIEEARAQRTELCADALRHRSLQALQRHLGPSHRRPDPALPRQRHAGARAPGLSGRALRRRRVRHDHAAHRARARRSKRRKRCARRSKPSACAAAPPTKIWAKSRCRSASRGCSRATRPQGLVERADACLYASKRNGRNQATTDATPVLYVA